jgi:hypothetical protein
MYPERCYQNYHCRENLKSHRFPVIYNLLLLQSREIKGGRSRIVNSLQLQLQLDGQPFQNVARVRAE